MEEAQERGNGTDKLYSKAEKKAKRYQDFRNFLAKDLSAQHIFPLLVA